MKQTGPNSGVSGGIGWTESGSAIFPVSVVRWKLKQGSELRRSIGPGDATSYRPLRKDDTLACEFEVLTDVRPHSADYEGRTVTVVLTANTGKTITCTVVAERVEFETAKKAGEAWVGALSGHVIGEPTYSAGWPEQVASSALTKADADQYAGSHLTYDADALGDNAQRTVFWWADLASDNFAGLSTKLIAVIAAHAAPTGMKYRPSTITQDVLDSGVIVLNYAPTTTGEDVINSNTTKVVDATDGLDDSHTVAAFGTPGAATDTTLQAGPIVHKELNDSKILQTQNNSRATTKQRIQNSGTHTADDPDDFGITASIRLVESNATISAPAAPHGLLIGWDVRPMYNASGAYTGRWEKNYYYGPSTNKQRIEQEGYFLTDVSGINDIDVQTLTGTSSTAPSDPATRITNLVVVRRQAFKVQNTPEKWKFVYTFGRLTAEEAIEFRGTSAVANEITPGISTVLNRETLVQAALSTDDVAEIVAAAQTTYRNTASYDRIAADKINKLVSRISIIRVNDNLMLGETEPYSRSERLGVLAGGTSGAVRISDAREAATGEFYVLIGVQGAYVGYKTIILRRRKLSIDNASDSRFLSVMGFVNSDTFLGYSAGLLMFMGSSQRTNWGSEGTNRAQPYDLIFKYRSIGWFDDGVIRPHIGRWIVSENAGTAGGTLALNQIKSSWIADAAGSTAFAGFLS